MRSVIWASLFVAAMALPIDRAVDLHVRQSSCAPVHMIVARGSNEAQGEGRMGTVATAIKQRIQGATSEAVVYPATISGYSSSVAQGTAAMTTAIKSYVDRCPQTKIVLLGWSQGGQALMDTLCGTSSSSFAATAPLATRYGQRVFAGVPFGEPTHLASQSYNAGTSVRNGLFPRTKPEACAPYYARLKSYCDTGDQYCDRGNADGVHGAYFDKYGRAAADFVVSKVA